jgi:L-alanine-DL-glutamate epimerase-like enolase superfamily enzyme
VSVPFIEPAPWRYGRLEGITSVLVELESDGGLVGWGEAPGVPSLGLVRASLEGMRPWLVGEDPARVARLLRLADDLGAHHNPHVAGVALAAVEMAVWDLCGKAAAVPAHALLGGLDAERIPFYWHVNVPDGTAAVARERAAEGLARGFTTLYLKAAADIGTDLGLARAVREQAGPGVPLRIDPNEAWTRLEVLRHLTELEALDLEFVEQPFDMDDHDGAAELRARGRVPVAANQSAWRLHDVWEVLRRGAADVVVTGLHQVGGMARLRDAAAICRVAGVPLVRHSLCDMGLATAAALHVLATLPPGQLAHQTHLTLLEHDLVSPRWAFEDGHLRVPSGPGLGVEIDEEAVARYERRFERDGEFVSYGFGAPPG